MARLAAVAVMFSCAFSSSSRCRSILRACACCGVNLASSSAMWSCVFCRLSPLTTSCPMVSSVRGALGGWRGCCSYCLGFM